jgi:hypothetical protein
MADLEKQDLRNWHINKVCSKRFNAYLQHFSADYELKIYF